MMVSFYDLGIIQIHACYTVGTHIILCPQITYVKRTLTPIYNETHSHKLRSAFKVKKGAWRGLKSRAAYEINPLTPHPFGTFECGVLVNG